MADAIASSNRATVAYLERIIEEQNDLIEELQHRLQEREHPKPRPVPAIS